MRFVLMFLICLPLFSLDIYHDVSIYGNLKYNSIETITDYREIKTLFHINFKEDRGLVSHDISTNNLEGALTNMLGTEWGYMSEGGFLDFDGINDYINFGNNLPLEYNEPFSMYIHRGSASFNSANRMCGAGAGSGTLDYRGWFVSVNTSYQPGIWFCHDYSTGNYIQVGSTDGSIDPNNDKRYLFTYDGSGNVSGMKIYIYNQPTKLWREAGSYNTAGNGITGTVQDASFNLEIGQARKETTSNWDGLLGEIAIWNAVLTTDEVQKRIDAPCRNCIYTNIKANKVYRVGGVGEFDTGYIESQRYGNTLEVDELYLRGDTAVYGE